MTDAVQPPAEKINATTKLAVDRTRLAYDGALMAWVRTAISLISFGFTIYKFFQIEAAGKQYGVVGATEFSVLMIVFGLVSLLMATLQHRRDLNALRAEYPHVPPRSLARVLAALISLLGILALVTVLLRD